jgi:hypothetical protein
VLLHQVLCIKVQDNNDLRTASKALDDAMEYFRLHDMLHCDNDY